MTARMADAWQCIVLGVESYDAAAGAVFGCERGFQSVGVAFEFEV